MCEPDTMRRRWNAPSGKSTLKTGPACTVSMRRGPRLCGLDGAFRFVCLFPVPREQFVQARDRHVRDAGDDVSEPCLGVDVVELGGADQGVDRGRTLPAAL